MGRDVCETERPMRRVLPGGYELDDDVDRIDLDAVHRYLAEESYWAEGRPRDVVEDLDSRRDACRRALSRRRTGRLCPDAFGRAHALVSRRRLRARRAPRQGAGSGARSRGGRGRPACAHALAAPHEGRAAAVRALRLRPTLRAPDGAPHWLTVARGSSRSRWPPASPSLSRTRRSSCSRCRISTANTTRRSWASRG